jgi:glycyl-tRNA synthetase beta chain
VRNIDERYTVRPDDFSESVEKDLFAAYQKAKAGLSSDASMSAVVKTLHDVMVEPINAFFDGVLVMAEDESVKQNRLALLQDIRDLTKGYADFSRLQGF